MGALTITPVEHPVPAVRNAGFGLDHPYIERCWLTLLGPTATLLLRRAVVLWTDQVPALVDEEDLARALGTSPGRLHHTADRLGRHHIGTWRPERLELDLRQTLPPLSDAQLARSPISVRSAHHRLMDAHLDEMMARA